MNPLQALYICLLSEFLKNSQAEQKILIFITYGTMKERGNIIRPLILSCGPDCYI